MPKKIKVPRVRQRCPKHGKTVHSLFVKAGKKNARCLKCKKESRDLWWKNKLAGKTKKPKGKAAKKKASKRAKVKAGVIGFTPAAAFKKPKVKVLKGQKTPKPETTKAVVKAPTKEPAEVKSGAAPTTGAQQAW